MAKEVITMVTPLLHAPGLVVVVVLVLVLEEVLLVPVNPPSAASLVEKEMSVGGAVVVVMEEEVEEEVEVSTWVPAGTAARSMADTRVVSTVVSPASVDVGVGLEVEEEPRAAAEA